MLISLLARTLSQISPLFLIVVMFVIALGDRLAANHPFHISTAEMEFNPKSKRLEVSLKLQAIDLEKALRGLAKRKVDIENDPKFDDLATRYLTENFFLAVKPDKSDSENKAIPQSPDDTPAPPKEQVKYVGRELETTWVWLHFELAAPSGDQPLVLVNRVLFEINTGQINTCIIRQAGKRHALKSTNSKPLQEFQREWLTASDSNSLAPTEPRK